MVPGPASPMVEEIPAWAEWVRGEVLQRLEDWIMGLERVPARVQAWIVEAERAYDEPLSKPPLDASVERRGREQVLNDALSWYVWNLGRGLQDIAPVVAVLVLLSIAVEAAGVQEMLDPSAVVYQAAGFQPNSLIDVVVLSLPLLTYPIFLFASLVSIPFTALVPLLCFVSYPIWVAAGRLVMFICTRSLLQLMQHILTSVVLLYVIAWFFAPQLHLLVRSLRRYVVILGQVLTVALIWSIKKLRPSMSLAMDRVARVPSLWREGCDTCVDAVTGYLAVMWHSSVWQQAYLFAAMLVRSKTLWFSVIVLHLVYANVYRGLA
ncbi:hypothetical protein K504DRAFT_460499 [Pleomassaria siparia CBS 279.74]|uniref:Uncharacterized protein n=1 Tax=Pleomassaria siparia CBS 279.74 TaxID=1314801 RepID=A0A6G1JX98_9PLEO|nr:hypothetical protein K504DRAFT_460499 [Pleomassaria siparia CBS 279.74]